MNDFTKGAWEPAIEQVTPTSNATTFTVVTDDYDIVSCRLGVRNEHDAVLIATAGTAATKLAEQGYDAVKVLEALPELLGMLEGGGDMVDVWAWFRDARGDL